MQVGRPIFADEMPSEAAALAVARAFEEFDAERRRLEEAIAEAQARIDAARAGRASLPSLGKLLEHAHVAMDRMERVYAAETERALRDADADARATIDAVVRSR